MVIIKVLCGRFLAFWKTGNQRRTFERKRARITRQKEKAPKTVYYSDELNDEFSGISKKTLTVDEHFPYLHQNPFWNLAAFFVYRVIMTPFAFLYGKLKFGLRIEGRRKLKEIRGQGIFLFGNHTLMAGDAFIPNLVTFPRRTYVVVHADNLSTKGTKNWVQMSGGLPLPTAFSGMRKFLEAMETRILQGHCIVIYPEAHIWPYYRGIRPFGSASFRYPVRFDAPVYATTTTFQKKRFGKTPRVTVYVDGPFYPDRSIAPREREKQLRDAVYETMCRRAENSTYSPVDYVRREENNT
ncbi:MAG: hypothetical protein IJW55_02960 [Clostridia bacterium]|nr:hypothetical protein [Clostridia bacterium]